MTGADDLRGADVQEAWARFAGQEPHGPVRVAIGDDCDLVTAGLTTTLQAYPERVELVSLAHRGVAEVDVVLQDPAWCTDHIAFGDLAPPAGAVAPRLVAFAWPTDPESVAWALAYGAFGYVSKSLSTPRLVEALELVAQGTQVLVDADGATIPGLGALSQLLEGEPTPREADVLSLIAAGASNAEIAFRLGVSVNTVKSTIRRAYRRIGVLSRSDAIRWKLAQGDASRADVSTSGSPRGLTTDQSGWAVTLPTMRGRTLSLPPGHARTTGEDPDE